MPGSKYLSPAAERMTAIQWRVIALIALVLFCDGLEISLASNLAPFIRNQFAWSPGQMGAIFSSGIAGLALGFLTLGPLADRWGRRPVILLSIAIFSAFTLLLSQAETVWSFCAIRALAGIGMGGAMGNASALVSEFAPVKRRAFVLAATGIGFMLGQVGSAILVFAVADSLGWSGTILLAGSLPVVLTLVLLLWLPESPDFLGRRSAAASSPTLASKPAPVAGPLQPSYRVLTLCLWVMSFNSILTIIILIHWLPVLAHGLGLAAHIAPLVNGSFQIGGIVGSLTVGLLVDRSGAKHTVAISLLGLASAALLSWSSADPNWMILTAGFAGAGALGFQSLVNILAASRIYPVEMRATGISWNLGVSRTGAIIGPLVGSWLLTVGGNERTVLAFTIIPMALSVPVAIILQRRLSQRPPA